jgi:hypothetical protein
MSGFDDFTLQQKISQIFNDLVDRKKDYPSHKYVVHNFQFLVFVRCDKGRIQNVAGFADFFSDKIVGTSCNI